VVAFVAAAESSYIIGVTLVVDGGLTAWIGRPPLMDRPAARVTATQPTAGTADSPAAQNTMASPAGEAIVGKSITG
jgi:hypothetical protein